MKNTQPLSFFKGCVQFTFGGGIGIRTPGCFHINGFQDRRFRPLSHLPIIQLKSLTQFFLLSKKLRHESFPSSTLLLFWYLRQHLLLCLNKIQKISTLITQKKRTSHKSFWRRHPDSNWGSRICNPMP